MLCRHPHLLQLSRSQTPAEQFKEQALWSDATTWVPEGLGITYYRVRHKARLPVSNIAFAAPVPRPACGNHLSPWNMIRSCLPPASGHEPFAIKSARSSSAQPGMCDTMRHSAGSLALRPVSNCQQQQSAVSWVIDP